MVITHNLSAANTRNRIKNVSTSIENSSKKLSSGYRINTSADDAAGLSISEKMRAQIRGLNRASKNAQDGISFIQTAEGALEEVQSMLKRCKELAVQAANDTNTDLDRKAIQEEIDQLTEHIDKIADTTQFNTMNVFSKTGASPDVAAALTPSSEKALTINVEWSFVDSGGNVVSVDASQAVGTDTSYKDSDFAKFVEKAAADAVAGLYSNYGTSLFSAASNNINIGLNLANIDGVGSTLASAALSMTWGSNSGGQYTTMSYTLNIDTSDYDMNTFATMNDAKKADLAATIAHEMTHLVMYDTVTDGMLSGNTKTFPKWFVEGMAQTSSGDNGWVSGTLQSGSNDTAIKNYMAQLKTMPYGAGYLGTMYLGYAASGSTSTGNLQADIVTGLNKIFTSLTRGKSLDEAIKENTSYSGQSAFEAGFSGADSASLDFVTALLNDRGSGTGVDAGAGSLLAASLSQTEAAAFAPSSLSGTSSYYVVKSDNTRYMNAYGSGYTFPPKSTGTAADSGKALNLQVGSLSGQKIQLERYNVSTEKLFDFGVISVTNHASASASISIIDKADQKISNVRSYYGALQNRLEHTINNLDNTSENTQNAESSIRDIDMAEEMVEYSKNNILLQAGQSILAQNNRTPEGVLSLLQ